MTRRASRAMRGAAVVLVGLLALVGCGEERGQVGEEGATSEASPIEGDIGTEVVGGVLYPPGIRLRDHTPIAVAQSKSAYVVTSGSYPYTVDVYSENGTVITHGDSVHGMALSDPSSDLATWITTSRPEDGRTRLVVIDTRTGEELENLAFNGDLEAVHENEIMFSSGGRHMVLAPGGGPATPLSLDPADGMVVWDFDADRVVYGDFETELHVAARDGSGVATFDDAYIGVLDPAGGRVAVMGTEGLVVAATDGTGEIHVDRDALAVWGMTWTEAGDVVLDPFPEDDDGEPPHRIVCPGLRTPVRQ